MTASIVNCDWGTTRLRLRVVRLDRQQVVAEFRSLDGIAAIASAHPPADRSAAYRSLLAAALTPLVEDQPELLSGSPILISGMASSSVGWQELPYASLPLDIGGSGLVCRSLEPIETRLGTHSLHMISGACSEQDVLRGEETELVGLFSLPHIRPLADRATVIKPGTHSKHLQVRQNQLVAFQTFMTGELFDVLSRHSILRHSLPPTDEQSGVDLELTNSDALRAGVRRATSLPLSAALFRVRTRQLLEEQPAASNRSFLAGVLLGAELGYLASASDSSVPLILAAAAPLHAPYRLALEELDLMDRVILIEPEDTELLSALGQARIWSWLGPTG